MPGRLAIDFGTCNTVLARWDDRLRQAVAVALPDFGTRLAPPGGPSVPVVPSLIHYADDGLRWLGEQVRDRGLAEAPATFRWMKRYISRQSPVRRRLPAGDLGPRDAGRDFLASVLRAALAEGDGGSGEVALTVPVEAFEHYQGWLTAVLEAAGRPAWRLIDEASAVALGYGANVPPGHAYLVIDFGGGTLDVAVVRLDADAGAHADRRCRVLGKAGADLGGATLDGWLFREALRRLGRRDSDPAVRRAGRHLLAACERAKEALSSADAAEVVATDPETGEVLATTFRRGEFDELLDRHDFHATLDGCIRRALLLAHEHGHGADDLHAVLLVGGTSLVPAVGATVRRIFGRDRVRADRPLDAAACGAAAFVAGAEFFDHVQHDYALRVIDPATRRHAFRPLIRRGTAYPTPAPVTRLTVRATFDGQTQLGLAVCELADPHSQAEGPVEIVFDPSGAARVVDVSADQAEQRLRSWLNEAAPTFLHADPPARRGEACFEVAFGIDASKRLVVTADDLRTGRRTLDRYPVVKLV